MTNIGLRKRSEKGCISARSDSRRIGRACAAIIFYTFFSQAFSLNGESMEYPVKIAFLYNFAKFVEWPPVAYRSPGAPLTICIVGHDPFSPEIEAEVRSKSVSGHPIEILTLKPTDLLRLCHMVFIPVTEKDQADKIVRGLNGASTLTVGEAAGFAMMGGMINFTLEGSKVHFEINRAAADGVRLKISSKLLSLAKIVAESGRQ